MTRPPPTRDDPGALRSSADGRRPDRLPSGELSTVAPAATPAAQLGEEERIGLRERERWHEDRRPRFPFRVLAKLSAAAGRASGRRPAPPPQRSEAEELVHASGLFDPDHYRARNPDVSDRSDHDVLRHFVASGGAEGRDPCALFDSSFYLDRNPDVREAGTNPLVHYLRWGWAEGRDPNPLFDTRFYVRTYPRVAWSGLNPLAHYLRFGAPAGLDPSPAFATSAYLAGFPELRARGVNPLASRLAALAAGWPPPLTCEPRPPRPSTRPPAPGREAWRAIRAVRHDPGRGVRPLVDVVVQADRRRDETLRSIHSVLSATCATPHRVVVLAPASAEPELAAELRFVAGLGLVELLEDSRRRGLAARCNDAVRAHRDRDVVVLAPGTEVYGDWLDRLRDCALREPGIGSASPLSNRASSGAYPFLLRDGDVTLEPERAALDRLAARANARRSIVAPGADGPCTYLRRRCLDDVGRLDSKRLDLGFGAELDLTLRARKRGWTHVLACDVFVGHDAPASGCEEQGRADRGRAHLAALHPEHDATLRRHSDEDPTREARARLDLARLQDAAGTRPLLFVTHNWGGGIERHVQDLRGRLEREGAGVVFLRPDPSDPHLAVLSHPRGSMLPNLPRFDLREGVDALVAALSAVRVVHVHVHSLVGFDQPLAADRVRRIARGLGVRLDFTLHDYAWFCPRIILVDGSGVYCGEPGLEACERCIESSGSPFGTPAVREWRGAYEGLLRDARVVLAPGADAAARFARRLPGAAARIQRHPEARVDRPPAPAPRERGAPLRVAVIGAIAAHKGFEVLLRCARDAAKRRLPITFHVVGHSSDDAALCACGNVSVLGRYDDAELPALLSAQRCDCALFPAVWPETYSYTLSAAVRASLHPIAFDLGEIAQRIRELGWGTLIPLAADPAAVNDAILEADLSPPTWERVRSHFSAPESILRDYYGLEPS